MENNNNIINDTNALNHSDISNISSSSKSSVDQPISNELVSNSSKPIRKQGSLRIKKNITQDEIEAQIQALMDKKAQLQKERIEADKKERELKEKEAFDNFNKELQTLQTTLSNESIIKSLMESGVTSEEIELSVVSSIWKLGDDTLKSKLLSRYKRITSKQSIYSSLQAMNKRSAGE